MMTAMDRSGDLIAAERASDPAASGEGRISLSIRAMTMRPRPI
jgi:hypothetical protein